MALSPTNRHSREPKAAPDTGAMVVDLLRRRLMGEPPPPQGFYGPVDEGLIADLRRRLMYADR